MPNTVLLDHAANGVATVTFNRPDAANAIDLDLAHDLLEATLDLANDGAVRAVVLRGTGQFFCGGGDVKSFVDRTDLPRHLREITVSLHASISNLRRMEAPIIAAVQGPAAGAGFGLACSADFVYASQTATFVMAYAALGLSPDAGSSWFVTRLVGARRAAELAFTNRRLNASEAMAWGIVSRVVADDLLESETADLARRLAAGPTRAFGHTKRLLDSSLDQSLEAHLDEEARRLQASATTGDAAEGVAAFVGRRPPAFTGY